MTTEKIAKQSVVQQPEYEQAPYGDFIIYLASIADDIQPWGGAWQRFRQRDLQLRDFWNKEPILASAIYNICVRDASFSWTLTGDAPRTIKATQDMLHNANLGKGWTDFVMKWKTDFMTQDNGAFFEVIRQSDSPDSPVMGINHLDSGRCRRTGVPDWPVIYSDRNGKEHKMLPHQIVATSDMPSPIETVNGVGFCAVSRVLRHAQFQRDISVRDRERSSGMDPKTLHMVSGVTQKMIENVIGSHREHQEEQGFLRYAKPVILSTVDPTANVSVESIDLAPRPDSWDYDVVMKWYITLLAMALGVDYQDLAPLPSKGIGGSQQSLILHQKSKGKGPEHFMKTIEHIFNFHGIIPKNVTFEYEEKDTADELEQADILKKNGEAHKVFIEAGIFTPQVSRNILLDEGLITQDIFDLASQGEMDATDDVEADDDERMDTQTDPNQSPLPDEQTKENLSNFAESERKGWENAMTLDMKKALDKTFKDIKKRLLPKKAIFGGDKQTPESLMGDEKFWREFGLTLHQAMSPNVKQIFLGVAEYNNGLGLAVDMNLINQEVLEFSRTYIPEFITMVEDSTKQFVADAVTAWQESGLGTRGLPDLVDTLQLQFSEARAKRIAQTETTRIFDLGNKAAHKSAGIRYEQWQTARDDRVRPEHQEYQNKVYALDEGPRPSDYINCRCSRVPIGEREAERILARQR